MIDSIDRLGWRRRFRQVAAWSVLASAPVNAVGVTALVGMYVGFAMGERSTALALGRTNDILGLIGTALMLPMVVEVHALTGPNRRAARFTIAVIGLGAMVSIIWLQALLVTERLTFERQIGPVMVAYLFIALWFVAGGAMATQSGVIAHGARLGAAAALYFGQPWWALRWGRALLALEASTPPTFLETGAMSTDPDPSG